MNKIAIITDSNSSMTQEEARRLGIFVIPMPFFIDGRLYLEELNVTGEEFYRRQAEGADITTSQPTLGGIIELWDKYLEKYDEIVYIPMSSALSGSCQNALNLAESYGGKVQVVNNLRISLTQQQSVLDAIKLKEEGYSAAAIREALEREKSEASIYITVDDLKYLKKSGRATAAAVALGTVLNVKPILQIQGGKLDAFAKARGWKSAKRAMLRAIEDDLKTRFADVREKTVVGIAYTCGPDEGQAWSKEVRKKFSGYELLEKPLPLSIACHIGPGALGIGLIKKI